MNALPLSYPSASHSIGSAVAPRANENPECARNARRAARALRGVQNWVISELKETPEVEHVLEHLDGLQITFKCCAPETWLPAVSACQFMVEQLHYDCSEDTYVERKTQKAMSCLSAIESALSAPPECAGRDSQLRTNWIKRVEKATSALRSMPEWVSKNKNRDDLGVEDLAASTVNLEQCLRQDHLESARIYAQGCVERSSNLAERAEHPMVVDFVEKTKKICAEIIEDLDRVCQVSDTECHTGATPVARHRSQCLIV